MAIKYCDHGAYGAYAAIPTWGAAQDGDGTAIGVGTPSTASVVFTGIPSSGSIFILGVVVTATWATSADNCANLLATAINALTTTAVGPASLTIKSQVRNHVYARGPANGAPAGTCQIMTRQASASHAGLVAFTHTLNNVSSAATVNFAGGTGGCWGYLFNHAATIWPQAVAIAGYGVWAAAMPYAGALLAGDIVKVRSNKTVALGNNPTMTTAPAAMGTLSNPIRFDIDNGTEWPADGATPVLQFNCTASAGGGYGFTFGSATSISSFLHIKGVTYPSGNKNLVFSASTTGAQINIAYQNVSLNMPARFENVEWQALGTPATTSSTVTATGLNNSSNAYQSASFVNCRFVWPGQSTAIINMGNGGYSYRADFYGCEFVATAMVTAATFCITLFNNNTHRLLLDSCKFTGFVTGSRLFAASSTTTGNNTAILRNCALGNVNTLGPNTLTSASGEMEAGERGVFITSQYGYHEFVYERAGRVYVEWVYAKQRPTLNATLHDGLTPWSIYAVPTTVAAQIGKHAPVEIPIICKQIPANADLVQGARTLTLNFLLESTVTWTKRDISVVLTYSNTDGTVAIFDTYDPDASALDASTASWSALAWGGLSWNRKQFQVTTPTAVLPSSQIGVVVRFHTAATADTTGVIIDPEVLVA